LNSKRTTWIKITVQQRFKITLYAGESLYKLFFITETPDGEYIIGAQKKSVAIYVIEEERL